MSEAGLRHLRETELRLKDSVIPVYRQVARGTPELIGSAVLLRIRDATFLCTAAHVLEAREGANVYLPHGDTLQPFVGRLHVTRPPSTGRRVDDKFDFALDRLDAERADRFTKYRVITLDQIDQNEVPQVGRLYTFIGFPASKNKSRFGTDSVQPEIVPYTGGPLGPQEYERYGFNLSIHLLVDFNRKKMSDGDGRVVTPTDPHGVSGGAVWKVGDLPDLEAGTNVEQFVGIAMECRHDALIAVRVSLILETIRSLHPDLAHAIPRSHWVDANVDLAAKSAGIIRG